MAQPLVFYDILVDPTGQDRQCWSANTWKTRLALNYKKVPYTTVWVQYGDIQTVMKEIGATPTDKRPTGEDRYTLPTICDPATGEVISDSAKIIAYLEHKYPERSLIPHGTLEQQVAFSNKIMLVLGFDFFAYVIRTGAAKMSPHSLAAFEGPIRSADHGPPLAERPPPTAENWKRTQEGFSRLAQQYAGSKYRFGDQLTYADLVIAGFLLSLYDSVSQEEQAEIRTWDDGHWGSFLQEVQSAGYSASDRGEIYVPS